jgi:hypothetical protein
MINRLRFKTLLFCFNAIICLTIFASQSEASFLSSLLKADFSAIKTDIEKMQNTIETKISTVIKMNTDLKADIKANASAIAGVNNRIQNTNTSTAIGGNQSITNDSQMIQNLNNKVLDTYKELTDKYIRLLRYVIGALFILIGKYELQIKKINDRLMAGDEQDDKFKEELIKCKEEAKK